MLPSTYHRTDHETVMSLLCVATQQWCHRCVWSCNSDVTAAWSRGAGRLSPTPGSGVHASSAMRQGQLQTSSSVHTRPHPYHTVPHPYRTRTFMSAHSVNCTRYSSKDMPPLPTSSISGSARQHKAGPVTARNSTAWTVHFHTCQHSPQRLHPC